MLDSGRLRRTVRRALALEVPTRHRSGAAVRAFARCALLAGSVAIPAAAQPPYSNELVPGLSSFDVGWGSRPNLADLDADGDLDAVVAEIYGSLKFFANTGSSTSPAFVEKTGPANPFQNIGPFHLSDPELADLDGDGDLDIVAGEWYGTLKYFENSGAPSKPAFVERTGGANPFVGIDVGYYSDPAMVDFDGDGDLDAIIGRDLPDLIFFRNTGSSSAPAFVAVLGTSSPVATISLFGDMSPDLADLDADGDLDAVVGNAAKLEYFENLGPPETPIFSRRRGSENPFFGFYLAPGACPNLVDLNGDGDLDVVAGDQYGNLRYYENTGTQTKLAFVDTTGTSNPFSGFDAGLFSSPELADLDADGDFDLVVGERGGELRYLENMAKPGNPALSFALRTGAANPFETIAVGSTSHPKLADLDADGDLDLVVGESYGSLRTFSNTGGPVEPGFLELAGENNPFAGIAVGTHSSPELADVDNDGDLDAVVGEFLGNLNYFTNTGTPQTPAFVERTGTANPFTAIQVPRRSSPDLADVDQDGDLDVVVGSVYGAVSLFENTSDSGMPTFEARTGMANPFGGFGAGPRSNPDLADLDGDGDLDVVVGEYFGILTYFRSFSTENHVFADGFESGDTSAWSATVP